MDALQPLRPGTVLDGEIVAVDREGRTLGFSRLQPRVPLTRSRDVAGGRRTQPAVFVAFDLLRDEGDDRTRAPFVERRRALERLVGPVRSPALRVSDLARRDGRALYERAFAEPGWEGVLAKRLASTYRPGRRSPDWRKLKIVQRQSAVVGGWTEHRATRTRSLLLGVYDAGRLHYIGHTVVPVRAFATARLGARLAALATAEAPFVDPPADTRTPPRWARPEVVVEIEHDGWADGTLRHLATFVGARTDVLPTSVHRESAPVQPRRGHRVSVWAPPAPDGGPLGAAPRPLAALVRQIETLERGRGRGTLTMPDGYRLDVSDLDAPVWPALGITRGALMRYYVTVAPVLLPVLADRPLVARYYPHGVGGRSFIQQRAPAEVPPGVRVEELPIDIPVRRRLVGGSLLTLLYLVGLGAVSQDSWLSRVPALDFPDHAVFDLDPMPGALFARVRDVARWIRDALDRLGIRGVPKTSGASGLHVAVALAPGTSWTASRTLCEAVAKFVVERHPDVATTERSVAARGPRVYIDCLQNLRTKTMAAAYSARATRTASVSTPVTWDEIEAGVEPQAFTIRTLPARLRRVGDLWAAVRTGPRTDVTRAAARP